MDNNHYSHNEYDNFNSQNSSDYLNAVNNYQKGASAGFEDISSNSRFFGQSNTALCREVITKSYLFMVVALLITAYGAFSATNTFIYWLATGNNYFKLVIAEIAIVFVSNWAIKKNNAILAGILYTAYSYLTGAVFSIILLVYTPASVLTIFLITAGVFAIMAIYGLVTKADLSSAGSICFMGLIGIIISSVVNMIFIKSSLFDTIICIIGVMIFVVLTAYDTQKIKARASYASSANVLSLSLFGAFELYLDFVNIFLKLLSLFGKKK